MKIMQELLILAPQLLLFGLPAWFLVVAAFRVLCRAIQVFVSSTHYVEYFKDVCLWVAGLGSGVGSYIGIRETDPMLLTIAVAWGVAWALMGLMCVERLRVLAMQERQFKTKRGRQKGRR